MHFGFLENQNIGSHQCLHWLQQHATGMLHCQLFKSLFKHKKKPILTDGLLFMAEKEGFEPSIPFWGIHDFQSCALGQLRDFSRSAARISLLIIHYLKEFVKPYFSFFSKNLFFQTMVILDNLMVFHYNIMADGVWRSLVSRLVRVQEASGSNPDTPTKQ